jgi:hypothetical protein
METATQILKMSLTDLRKHGSISEKRTIKFAKEAMNAYYMGYKMVWFYSDRNDREQAIIEQTTADNQKQMAKERVIEEYGFDSLEAEEFLGKFQVPRFAR